VLDVDVRANSQLPIQPDPPVARYLEEVPIGMKGGQGDQAAEATRARMEATKSTINSSAASTIGDPVVHRKGVADRRAEEEAKGKNTVGDLKAALFEELAGVRAERMELLNTIIEDDPAEECCRALFWLVMGGIYPDRIHDEVAGRLRVILGEGWTAIARVLQANPLLHGRDRPVKDWVIGCMPYVFVQAIFRLMCDGFPEDRKYLVSQADHLVTRVCFVVHYELFGFQIVADTARRARKKLFLKSCFRTPYADQREVLKGQKQLKLLESDNTANGPLAFGNMEGNSLQENQLDHVMQAHRTFMEEWNFAKEKGKPLPLDSPVPDDLTVDRYDGVSGVGVSLFEQHMQLMAKAAGDDSEAMAGKAHYIEAFLRIDIDGSGGIDEYEMSTALQNLGFALTNDQVRQMIDEVDDDGNGEVGLQEFLKIMTNLENAGEDEEDDENQGGQEGEEGEEGSEDGDDDGSPRNKDASTSKAKNPKSAFALANMNDLTSGGGRAKSKRERERKQKLDSLMKKIVSEPLKAELMQKQINTTWVSPGMMRKVKADDRLVLKKTPAETYHVSMVVPERTLTTPFLNAHRLAHKSSTGAIGGLGRSGGATGSLPALNSRKNEKAAAAQAGTGPAEGEEVVWLHPPERLQSRKVLTRLENEGKAFQHTSFSNYVKEADVMSGGTKQHLDDQKLGNEEKTYIRKVGTLVRGQPKKLIPPETMLARNFRNRNRGPVVIATKPAA